MFKKWERALERLSMLGVIRDAPIFH